MVSQAHLRDGAAEGAAIRRAILLALRHDAVDAFSSRAIAARLALPTFTVQRALDELVRGGFAVLDEGEYRAADPA